MVTLQSIGFGDNIQPKQESKNDFITVNSMLILAQKKPIQNRKEGITYTLMKRKQLKYKYIFSLQCVTFLLLNFSDKYVLPIM